MEAARDGAAGATWIFRGGASSPRDRPRALRAARKRPSSSTFAHNSASPAAAVTEHPGAKSPASGVARRAAPQSPPPPSAQSTGAA